MSQMGQNLRLPQRNIDSCLTSVSRHYASEAVQPFVAPSMSSLDEHRRGDLGAGRGPRRQGRLPDRRRRHLQFPAIAHTWCGLTSHGRRSPNSLFMSLAAHNSEFHRWSGGVDRRICQTFAASPAEPGELPCWFSVGIQTQNPFCYLRCCGNALDLIEPAVMLHGSVRNKLRRKEFPV
jgi:hypothetical protein